MLVKYLLQPDIPDNIVEPIPDDIFPLPHEFLTPDNLLANPLEHTGDYRPPLRPVLLEVQGNVVVLQIIVEGGNARDQGGRDVHSDVGPLVKGCDGKLQRELVAEVLELLLVDVFV